MPLVAEYEHRERCRKAVADLWMHLKGATDDELTDAQEAVAQALATLPIGATDRQVKPLARSGSSTRPLLTWT